MSVCLLHPFPPPHQLLLPLCLLRAPPSPCLCSHCSCCNRSRCIMMSLRCFARFVRFYLFFSEDLQSLFEFCVVVLIPSFSVFSLIILANWIELDSIQTKIVAECVNWLVDQLLKIRKSLSVKQTHTCFSVLSFLTNLSFTASGQEALHLLLGMPFILFFFRIDRFCWTWYVSLNSFWRSAGFVPCVSGAFATQRFPRSMLLFRHFLLAC